MTYKGEEACRDILVGLHQVPRRRRDLVDCRSTWRHNKSGANEGKSSTTAQAFRKITHNHLSIYPQQMRLTAAIAIPVLASAEIPVPAPIFPLLSPLNDLFSQVTGSDYKLFTKMSSSHFMDPATRGGATQSTSDVGEARPQNLADAGDEEGPQLGMDAGDEETPQLGMDAGDEETPQLGMDAGDEETPQLGV